MKISDLSVGANVVLGSRDDEDIVWRKISADCDFMSISRVCRFYFDHAEPRSDSRARRNHGYNFYPHSNIHQWLNAAGTGWYESQHEFDESPYFRDEPGFLSGFSIAERNVLVPQQLTVAVPLGSRKQFGRQVTMSALVALPSASQCGCAEPEVACEGAKNPEIDRVLGAWKATLTRTGFRDAGHVIFSGSDWQETICADESRDVFPIIRLNPATPVGDTPDQDGFYWPMLDADDSAESFLSFITA